MKWYRHMHMRLYHRQAGVASQRLYLGRGLQPEPVNEHLFVVLVLTVVVPFFIIVLLIALLVIFIIAALPLLRL